MMSLPPGFRFHPTDIEVIKYHLKRKALGKKVHFEAISEVDIYKFHPSDLPDKSCLKNKDLEWYFFCPVLRKYTSGARLARATDTGYWKSTGKDRPVSYNNQTVGMIKTLVFHEGHAPKGDRTDWVIHEYRILEQELAGSGLDQAPYVVVKLFKKSGPGPKNGAQYGAPFNEQEWDSDGEDRDEICVEPPLQISENLPLLVVASSSLPPPVSLANDVTPPMVVEEDEVDIESLLGMFFDDVPPATHDQVNGEVFMELDDIYGGLEDLVGLEDLLNDSFE